MFHTRIINTFFVCFSINSPHNATKTQGGSWERKKMKRLQKKPEPNPNQGTKDKPLRLLYEICYTVSPHEKYACYAIYDLPNVNEEFT